MRFVAQLVVCFCFLVSAAVNAVEKVSVQARTMSETVGLAVANHPEARVKFSELKAQGETIRQVESSFLPQLSLGLGVGREHSNNTSTRAGSPSGSEQMVRRESSVNLSQMLFDGFKTHWQRESALETEAAIELELAYVASEVAIRAVESHLEVARSNQVLNINIDNLNAHQEIAADIQARAKSGKDDWARVSQIHARLSLSLANVEAAKNEVMKANASYLQAVGVAPGKKLFFQEQLFRMPDSLTELIEQVNHSNFLILSRTLDQRSALSDAKAAKNTDMPSLFLESGATWNDNLDGIDGRNGDAFVMLRMRYDLFRGGADNAAKQQAVLLSQRASYQLDDVRRGVRRDVEYAWHDYQSSAKRVKFLADYHESALLTKTAYEKQFRIGQRTLIDLLDAENEMQRARRLMVDAQKELYLSKYRILNLQGQLLEQLAVNLPGID